MRFYELLCATCNKAFPSVLATSPEELLNPDFEEVEQTGIVNADRFRDFYREHSVHGLTTAEVL